jgi:hypothetical protein
MYFEFFEMRCAGTQVHHHIFEVILLSSDKGKKHPDHVFPKVCMLLLVHSLTNFL